MKKYNMGKVVAAAALCLVFALWTAGVKWLDVQPIGPEGSCVGFSGINGWFHRLTGVHWTLYDLTDWLGLVPIGTALAFAGLGLGQWIRRKKLSRVDRSLFVLGGFYVVVAAAYVMFEKVVSNYRPVLVNGILEASYPSSTTLLTLCVMPTAVMQLRGRLKNNRLRKWLNAGIYAFTALMVIGRLLSGVHWLSDILGGMIFSTAMVLLYEFAAEQIENR